MKYLSVCSGIEAATVAWHHMGWQPVAFSDIEPFPSAVLAHHYPHVPNLGDMTKFEEWNLEPVDLLVGGTPCQSFSVAGLRKGLADPRGNLMLTFLAIAQRQRPRWIVWENVPGVLSSNGGRDFGTFLGALGELGYGFAYRVLDAQWFGVAQRRRRVFVVGCLGDWQRPAQVLFERESVRRDTAPSREKREATTGGIARCFVGSSESTVAQPVAFYDYLGSQGGGVEVGVSPTLKKKDGVAVTQPVAQPVAFQPTADCLTAAYGTKWNGNASADNGSLFAAQPVAYVGGVDYENNAHTMEEPTGPLLKGSPTGGGRPLPAIATAMQVRRLTPVECERLQGFPDGYTNIPWRKKPESPDGPRYKALGNSMAVPVMRWIGERIRDNAVD
jgi:DNA (cytosine-5)-methyltransferase 1